jgi:hypothetical protein
MSRDWFIRLLFPISRGRETVMIVIVLKVKVMNHLGRLGAFHHRKGNRGIYQRTNSDLLESPCLFAVQEGPVGSERIKSLEERGDYVADGGEDRLEVRAEDEDHTSQFDRIGNENADHDHETALQLALPRQVCLLC